MLTFIVGNPDSSSTLQEDRAKLKDLQRIEDGLQNFACLLNYSIYITEGLDSTADSTSPGASLRRTTRSSYEEATLKRKLDDEIENLIEEYEKAREDSVNGLVHLKSRLLGPEG
jgi:hypothetical protein